MTFYTVNRSPYNRRHDGRMPRRIDDPAGHSDEKTPATRLDRTIPRSQRPIG